MKTKQIFTIKMLAAAIAAVIVFASMVPASFVTASADEILFGDIDGDGSVDSGDALLVMRLSIGLDEATDEILQRADINGDGAVDSLDALMLLQSAIGIIDLESVESQASRRAANLRQQEIASYIQRVTELCNAERAKVGACELEIDLDLCKMAGVRAYELKDECSHTRPNGEQWTSILTEYNYNFLCAGENLAGGIRTPEEVVQAWMNSEGHRAIILNPKFTRIGVGYAFVEDSYFGYYWDQIFSGISEAVDEQASKKSLLDDINEARRAKGLSDLRVDTSLDIIAEIRATDITEKMDNKRPDGSDWKALLDEYNVEYYTVSQSYCAGFQNETEVFDYYMDGSKEPKFLDPDNKGYTRIGIGHAFVDNDEFGHYWVIILTDE